MVNKFYTKYIFLTVAIINVILQLSEKPIKISNWISGIGFLVLSIMHFINESKKK
jgi:uncharacterized protein with PQ loop repeat